ncbi:DNA ligase I [Colletotrichum orchidophilum]|uniref:DNA ligase n=1 Tax=Colletotrichum orchidophilum TaxID=1209926 RepID=A0A1G4BQA9_9PEZI|nr:DNA ligase I [Colletotrichum orchidophilum]OHF03651.1 DNA ligase I [Colletotrichum orchidophilum]
MSQRKRQKSPDATAIQEEERQYAIGGTTLEELNEKYPNRPRNHSQTMRFSELFKSLFNPLNENKKQPAGRGPPRTKKGPHGPHKLSPQEQRRHIIERFISRWRNEVGNDIYPALRLILPDKDRDRGVYGLKENAIGKLLVKLMKIDKNSEDGHNLLHWKLPGQTTFSRLAGDFAGRCFEVLSKRPMRTEVGDMTIAEVNELLDKLAASSGELESLEVFEIFYERMNAEELMWLIRIVLKQMKVGATERTFLDLWHPDGEALFSVSSSLRRVCWELFDPKIRLEQDDTGVTLMECFQPQLAQFQMPSSFQKMVDYLRTTEEDPEFWIEEKLDGERMQMHMAEDASVPGGWRFCFWSRKAKDYTYLYGNGLKDEKGALTRHLADAFSEGVRNVILDGEMITWDPEVDKIMPFGTLKTAALAEQNNPYSNSGPRPLYRVFDILLLNDQPLTQYTLRDRRRALGKAVKGVHRRLEIHEYESATTPDAIEPLLRKVVAEASEGLVLKNPRSMYRLNSRNDDWLKVKPEYMSEFGESLDCVVIGGYYGSGRRGGAISSFMCGLRVSENHIKAGANPEKCFSFFKVGGGFSAGDYAEIRHRTDGKWNTWDSKKPPVEYIELAGGDRQFEKPDVWIRPSESVVVEAKAASIGNSEQFALGFTLRFPRFRKLRPEKNWDEGLSVQEFLDLRRRVEAEAKEKTMSVENRKRKSVKRIKREVVIAGTENMPAQFQSDKSKTFKGLEFCVLSESLKPFKKTKAQLETLIKENGGQVSQRASPQSGMILVADKNVVKVASLVKEGQKGGGVNIIRPLWIQDCLEQADDSLLLPYEERHLLHATEALKTVALQNTDMYGDSYARDINLGELRNILKTMPKREPDTEPFDKAQFLNQLEERGRGVGPIKGSMFHRCVVHLLSVALEEEEDDINLLKLRNYLTFGGARLTSDADDAQATHIVVVGDSDLLNEAAAALREEISHRRKIPHIVTADWVEECWRENTLLDEERYTTV